MTCRNVATNVQVKHSILEMNSQLHRVIKTKVYHSHFQISKFRVAHQVFFHQLLCL